MERFDFPLYLLLLDFLSYFYVTHFKLQKVVDDCDAVDPSPVPRKLRSGISNCCVLLF